MAPLIAYQFPATEGATLFELPAGQTNLGVGAPGDDILEHARAAFRAAAPAALDAPLAQRLFQYGPVQGDGGFLTALAAFLARQYGPGEPPPAREHLIATSGASFGLVLACQRFLRAGQPVFVEDPSYFIARDVFRDARLDLVSIPGDANGMDIDALEAALAARLPATNTAGAPAAAAAGARDTRDGFEGLIYIVPTFGNPSSRTLSAARRAQLVQAAYRHRVLVVCDDVYNLLRFADAPAPPPPRLVTYDTGPGCVISNGSFSKVFGPGVRLGWIEAPPQLVARLLGSGLLASGGSANHLTSGIFRRMMEDLTVDRVLEHARTTYGSRSRALCDALEASLPVGFTFARPHGGFFVWVVGPPDFVAEDAAKICREQHNLVFQPGTWSSSGGGQKNCFRLSLAYNQADVLVGAVGTLCSVLHAARK